MINPETIYLCIYIFDKFLEKGKDLVNLKNIQLVATTSLLIASKIEEIYPPELRCFVYRCNKLFDKHEFVKMESLILSTLNYETIYVSPYKFLLRLHTASMLSDETFYIAQYFLELSLLDGKMSSKKSSTKAASSYYLALKISNSLEGYPGWIADMEDICKINKMQVKAASKDMCNIYEEIGSRNNLKSAYEKFAMDKYLRASCKVKEFCEKKE